MILLELHRHQEVGRWQRGAIPFVPFGLLIKSFDPAFVAEQGLDLKNLTWDNFLVNNLLPVTIGNIIGGAVLVAAIYWSVFLRSRDA